MFDLLLQIQTLNNSQSQLLDFSSLTSSIQQLIFTAYYSVVGVVTYTEFLTASHLNRALNDHVVPGFDLEVQKIRHTYTSILAVCHKTTASYKNTGAGNSNRIQFPLIPPDVLAMRPSFVLVQCPMSFTLSCSCDKKFRDEMFPKYSVSTISGMLATSK